MVSQPIDETKMEDGLVDNTEPASKYHGLETLKVVEEYIKKCKERRCLSIHSPLNATR